MLFVVAAIAALAAAILFFDVTSPFAWALVTIAIVIVVLIVKERAKTYRARQKNFEG